MYKLSQKITKHMLLVTIITIHWVSEKIYLQMKYLKNYVTNKLLILRMVWVIIIASNSDGKVYCWVCNITGF